MAEGKYEAAYEQAKLAFAQSQQSRDRAQQARAAQVLAIAASYLGRTAEAIDYFKQASAAQGA